MVSAIKGALFAMPGAGLKHEWTLRDRSPWRPEIWDQSSGTPTEGLSGMDGLS